MRLLGMFYHHFPVNLVRISSRSDTHAVINTRERVNLCKTVVETVSGSLKNERRRKRGFATNEESDLRLDRWHVLES